MPILFNLYLKRNKVCKSNSKAINQIKTTNTMKQFIKWQKCPVCTLRFVWKAIWDKLPEYIFENFEIAQVIRGLLLNQKGDLSQKLPEPSLLLLVNHGQPTSIETEALLKPRNDNSMSGQLWNNSVNPAMLIKNYIQTCD